jgi:hypothetical protein
MVIAKVRHVAIVVWRADDSTHDRPRFPQPEARHPQKLA